MTEDEKFVRETWAHVTLMLHHGTSHGRIELPHAHARFVSVDPGYDRAWSEAARFTRQRLEEIRQVEEEVRWMQGAAKYSAVFPSDAATVDRILAREQAALSDLRKGMKQSGSPDSKGAY